MRMLPLIISALGAIILSALVVATANGAAPGWIAVARPLCFALTMISLVLSRQGFAAPGARWAVYQGYAPIRFFLALVALILIPFAIFAAYHFYYGPLISMANGNDQAF